MGLVLAVAFAATAVVSPSGVELEWLTDNSVNPPGVSGDFIIEMIPPVSCRDAVLFHGITYDDIRTAIYSASSSGLEVIANANTPVPGSDQTFQSARREDCAGDRIVFVGTDGIRASIFSSIDGVITSLLDAGTAIGDNEVTGFANLDAGDTVVALDARLFPPSTTQAMVIKPYDGEPFIVADRTTVLPGQTNPVTIFSQPVLAGSDFVFHARTQQSLGIYRWNEAEGISVIADTETPVPTLGGGTFGIFDWITSLNYGVVFGAGYFGGFGLFVWNAGEIQPLVVPGHETEGGEIITSAGFPTGAGYLLTFTAKTATNAFDSIFVRTLNGNVRRILGRFDPIDGHTVNRVLSGANSTSVSLLMSTTDAPPIQIIYRASFAETVDIPALSRAGVIALVLVLMLAGLWALRSPRSTSGHRVGIRAATRLRAARATPTGPSLRGSGGPVIGCREAPRPPPCGG